MLAENFSTKVRYTGVAFCYNMSFAIAAIIPSFVAYIYKATHTLFYINIIFILIAIFSIPCCLMMKNYMRQF